jgi:hypothetical protein
MLYCLVQIQQIGAHQPSKMREKESIKIV